MTENQINNNCKPVPETLEQWFEFLVNSEVWEDDIQSVKIIRSAYPNGIPYILHSMTLNLRSLKKRHRNRYIGIYTEQHLKYLFNVAQQQYEIDNPRPLNEKKITKITKIKKLYTYVRCKRLWYDENLLVSYLCKNFIMAELQKIQCQTLKLADEKIKRYQELYPEFTTLKEEERRLKNAIALALNKISDEILLRAGKVSGARQSDSFSVDTSLTAPSSEQKEDLESLDNTHISQYDNSDSEKNVLKSKEPVVPSDTEESAQSVSYDEVDVKASVTEKRKNSKSIRISPDHKQTQISAQESGDKGEEIVLQYEKNKLKELNFSDDIINSVHRVSLISDDYGYDIVSYDELGQEIYIEVKSTRKGLGNLDFFYTDNELQTAKQLENRYKIYIVFGVLGDNPIIRNIGNPIISNKVTIKPIQYSVNVRID